MVTFAFKPKKMPATFTFHRNERLRRKKLIDELFKRGKSLMVFPIRSRYLSFDRIDHVAVQILISVPKKRFKKAVDRNLIKRRMKEAYRLHKEILNSKTSPDKTILIACIYANNEIVSFKQIESAMVKTLEKLNKNL